MLLSFLIAILTTYLLSIPASGLSADPTAPAPRAEVTLKTACPLGECCEFKLRMYQRCIPKDNYGTKNVQTWPLFYDFLDKDRKPIQPITGDYNMKACLFDDCQWVSVGNITGPDDFYMRWQYGDDQKYNGGKGLAIMTYEFGGIDHEDQERCVVEEWTDYPGELTRWVHDCQAKENTAFANRTRVCSL